MRVLTEGMADAAGREHITTGKGVEKIERTADGAWLVTFEDGSTDTGDAVIVATESWAAEKIVRGVDEDITVALSGIPSSSSATVSMAFEEEGFGVDTNAFGVLCPLVENRALMAATFSSTKWPGRAPAGKVLMRGFVGGPHNQAIMEKSDEELAGIVLEELRGIIGVPKDAKPLFQRVFRWHLGMPQYTMGHLDRVDTIEERCAAIPGLALAGGGYRGVGLPNCIEGGERGVTKVLGEWGIELEEDHVEEKRAY
jgi:oxygen-dependent protoporphyrinogen oxidase